MKYCETCRVSKKYLVPGTYPYHDYNLDKCEICHKQKQCYDYPALFIRPKSELSLEEIKLDKQLQQEYSTLAEDLILSFCSGRQAGHIDHQRSDELRKVVVKRFGEPDWYATYLIRKKIQEGYQAQDQIKNRRTL